jgi:hypothetical protein
MAIVVLVRRHSPGVTARLPTCSGGLCRRVPLPQARAVRTVVGPLRGERCGLPCAETGGGRPGVAACLGEPFGFECCRALLGCGPELLADPGEGVLEQLGLRPVPAVPGMRLPPTSGTSAAACRR